MPGYDQPTASSSRKAVEKAPSPTRLQPESPAGQAYARDSSVCSDIGPSLTIKQRAETQQRDTQHARAEPEPLASPKTEPTTIFPSLKRKSVIRPAHLDRELYRAAMEREHISKYRDLMPSATSPSKAKTVPSANVSLSDFSKDLPSASIFSGDFSENPPSAVLSATDISSTDSSNLLSKNMTSANLLPTKDSSTDLRSMTGDATNQNLDRLPVNAIPADAEDAKQPKNTVLKTLGQSAEPAKEESAAPATVATRPEPSRLQPNMAPPPAPGLRPTMTTAISPSRLIAPRAPAFVKQYTSLAPRLPIRVHASPSSSKSPPTPGRKCMWCGGREHTSVDCDKPHERRL
ncbi:hypothetical protein COL940_010636 [Colletotrichum noveboracense]|nr:hypothetical protein COL940_010636 [Colletotrichum noveboracense]